MKTKEELLNDFLNGHPNSSHPFDTERFVRYAIQCAKGNASIDTNTMLNRGVESDYLEKYETAYSWIKTTVEILFEEKQILK